MAFSKKLKYSICRAILVLFTPFALFAQQGNLYFNHLSVEDGLSQSTIFSIYKDQLGFTWFGTRRGLNQYDGYRFQHYMHDITDSNTLSSNTIYSIIGDSKDNLIIQTEKQLNYFDRYKQKFICIPVPDLFWNFVKDRENKVWTCSHGGIFTFNEEKRQLDTIENLHPFTSLYDITLDTENIFWITGENSVIQYNPVNRNYKTYSIENPGKQRIFIEKDSKGRIWICLTDGTLLLYDASKDKFKEIFRNEGYKKVLVSSFGSGLEDKLVIGTDGNGIRLVNTSDFSIKKYNHQPDNAKGLSSNTYYSVYADNKLNILWLGSYMGGLDYYSKYDKGLRFIYHQPNNPKSIVNNNIRSLFFDTESKLLWVGTRQGISVLDTLNKVVRNFTQEELIRNGITKPIITKIWKDPSGYIWLCTYKGGIAIYDPRNRQLKSVAQLYPQFGLPLNLGIFDIIKDSHNNCWIASESGTYFIPNSKKAFVFNPLFSKTLLEDRSGRIFIGTSHNGLLMVNSSLQVSEIQLSSVKQNENNERINALCEDNDGNIWVSTGGNGIFKYNPYNDKTENYSTQNGLPDNYIAGIVIDPSEVIWVSTYSNIARYKESSNLFNTVYIEKGIKGKEFNPNSIALNPNGSIYLGSINGLLKFNVNQFRENPFLPRVIFTNIFVNNKHISVSDKKTSLENHIMFTNEIDLKHDQNTIRLEFTAPEYFLGDKVRFLYKIEEENNNWISLGNNRSLNLVNLNPGKYTLNVKAVNSDGHSTLNGTKLVLYITPPPWKTWYAYVLYTIVIMAMVFVLRLFIKSKLKLKYELLLQKSENEKIEEINRSRIRLFTDVSHEIGNLLTMLNLPLETLNNIEVDDLKKHYLEIINKNVNRLITLIKRIIELRKIETGNIPLHACQDDLILFIKDMCVNFQSLARRKNIKFIIDFKNISLVTWFDKEKLEYILFNLLSNAFKFEPENGMVILNVWQDVGLINEHRKKRIVIQVQNKGSFISPEIAEHIFDRFYTGKYKSFGSGIGLSLTKSYVSVHKGDISFTTDKTNGVTFEVALPFGDSYLTQEEKLLEAPTYEMNSYDFLEQDSDLNDYDMGDDEEEEKYKMLIIEQNVELLQAIKEKLAAKYEIIDARDDDDSLIKAKTFQPDIIIVGTFKTVLNISGPELCRSIKRNVDTSHIPIVIVSPHDDIEIKIKAMEAGADFFISKPFSITYLISISKNLINLRSSLKKKFNYEVMVNEKEIDLTSMDEKFIEKAYTILDANIDNTQFGIPEFIDGMGISKYMLYSKIKSLTGQTPNDFILTYKLKIAAKALRKKNMNDTELYEKLGFNDISYFRKCFKKFYGTTPNRYKKSIDFMDEGEKSNS